MFHISCFSFHSLQICYCKIYLLKVTSFTRFLKLQCIFFRCLFTQVHVTKLMLERTVSTCLVMVLSTGCRLAWLQCLSFWWLSCWVSKIQKIAGQACRMGKLVALPPSFCGVSLLHLPSNCRLSGGWTGQSASGTSVHSRCTITLHRFHWQHHSIAASASLVFQVCKPLWSSAITPHLKKCLHPPVWCFIFPSVDIYINHFRRDIRQTKGWPSAGMSGIRYLTEGDTAFLVLKLWNIEQTIVYFV